MIQAWNFQNMLSFFCFCFFNVRLLSVLCGHSVFSSSPQRPITSDFDGFFYPRFYPLHLFSYLNSWERASIFPFKCLVLNKGTTGTSFNVFGLTRSLTVDWIQDLPHVKLMFPIKYSQLVIWKFKMAPFFSRWLLFYMSKSV